MSGEAALRIGRNSSFFHDLSDLTGRLDGLSRSKFIFSIAIVPLQWYNCCMKEYIAYKGEKFTIEWYYSEKGESQPLEFFDDLNAVEQ